MESTSLGLYVPGPGSSLDRRELSINRLLLGDQFAAREFLSAGELRCKGADASRFGDWNGEHTYGIVDSGYLPTLLMPTEFWVYWPGPGKLLLIMMFAGSAQTYQTRVRLA